MACCSSCGAACAASAATCAGCGAALVAATTAARNRGEPVTLRAPKRAALLVVAGVLFVIAGAIAMFAAK